MADKTSVIFMNQPDPKKIANALAMCVRITKEKQNPGKAYSVTVVLGDGTKGESVPGVCAS